MNFKTEEHTGISLKKMLTDANQLLTEFAFDYEKGKIIRITAEVFPQKSTRRYHEYWQKPEVLPVFDILNLSEESEKYY